MASTNAVPSHVSDAKRFLQLVASKFEWGDLEEEIIMDVGCGNPKVKFCDLLLEQYPAVKQVISVDKKSNLIAFVQCTKKHPKLTFAFADIEFRSTLSQWEGQMGVVVSSHCFHQLSDQAEAFRNVHHLLKPGGEAAFLYCLQSGFAGWHQEMAGHPEWKRYYNGNSPAIPITQNSNEDAAHYRKMLENLNFTVVYCQKDRIGVPFESEEAWKETTFKLSCSSFTLPVKITEDFKKDLFDCFMKHNGRDDKGRPCQMSFFLTALVRKPTNDPILKSEQEKDI